MPLWSLIGGRVEDSLGVWAYIHEGYLQVIEVSDADCLASSLQTPNSTKAQLQQLAGVGVGVNQKLRLSSIGAFVTSGWKLDSPSLSAASS